ncbi:ATP-dependent helicase [Patescibacteria group bacterium]
MPSSSDILTQLNPIQQEAVAHGFGPLLIIAGAGSGKTRALTHRAAYLIKEKNVAPENILLVTFTNKAADEMRERLKKLVGQAPPHSSTFHSFCARVLRQNGHRIGIPINFSIYDDKDQRETIKLAMEKIEISPKQFPPASILTTISQAKNEMISALEYPQYARGHFQTTVARIYLTYQRLLKEFHALDFDDLLFETVRLLRKDKEVLSYYQNNFRHILVDEYQDTNHTQYVLTKLLAKKWRSLCVVGDAAQSIYGWRGANHRNLTHLKRDFPDLKIINLEQNYRSTQTILKAANQVIKRNSSHPILNLWTKNEKGERISLFEANSEINEASFVTTQIINQLKNQNYTDFAVLYRTNAQSRVIEEAFLKKGIPYSLVGGVRFYERKEIKDCLAYLKIIANPQDTISYQRAEKIGKRRLAKFLKLADKIGPQIKSTNKATNLHSPTTLNILDQILKATDYLSLFNPKNELDLARLENIKELRSVATQFPKLDQFLENVALVQQEYLPNSPGKNKKKNGVTLMTAHAAKGTEFKTIFLIGLEEGLFPHSRSMMEKDELEEERRLFYVGVTRAKKKLYLIHARKRLYFGQRSHNFPSRFINDIPPDLIEKEYQDLIE